MMEQTNPRCLQCYFVDSNICVQCGQPRLTPAVQRYVARQSLEGVAEFLKRFHAHPLTCDGYTNLRDAVEFMATELHEWHEHAAFRVVLGLRDAVAALHVLGLQTLWLRQVETALRQVVQQGLNDAREALRTWEQAATRADEREMELERGQRLARRAAGAD